MAIDKIKEKIHKLGRRREASQARRMGFRKENESRSESAPQDGASFTANKSSLTCLVQSVTLDPMGKVIKMRPKGPQTNLTVYVLNMWDKEGFWGTLGVYVNLSEAKNDAEIAFGTRAGFVKYRIESVGLIPMTHT